jgi:amidase
MLAITERLGEDLPQVGEVTEASTERRRIAFSMIRTDGSDVDADVIAATESTAQLCRDLGHEVVEVTPPVMGTEYIQRFLTVWASGPAQLKALAEAQTGTPIEESQLLEPWTIGLANMFAEQTAENPEILAESLAYFQQVEADIAAFFEGYDLWLTPTLASAPPPIGEQAPTVPFETLFERTTQYVAFTSQHNVAGTPAMSVPLNWNEAGLPIGSQFAAAQGNERALLELAYELEEARPWAERWGPSAFVNL